MPDPVILPPESPPLAPIDQSHTQSPSQSESRDQNQEHEHSRRQLEALLEVSEAIAQQRDLPA